MAHSTEESKRPCRALFPCFYRRKNLCVFREWEKAVLEVSATGDPENRDFYRSMIGILDEPCLELNEEERKRGIMDILGLHTAGE